MHCFPQRWVLRRVGNRCRRIPAHHQLDLRFLLRRLYLQNSDGLPAAPNEVPNDYPLRISWPGILVDDPGHSEDIVTRVREAIEVIWRDRAEAIEQEACEILGVKSLRDYFSRPASFFADHLNFLLTNSLIIKSGVGCRYRLS